LSSPGQVDSSEATEGNGLVQGKLPREVAAPEFPEEAKGFRSFGKTEVGTAHVLRRQDFKLVVVVVFGDFGDAAGDRDSLYVLLPLFVLGKENNLDRFELGNELGQRTDRFGHADTPCETGMGKDEQEKPETAGEPSPPVSAAHDGTGGGERKVCFYSDEIDWGKEKMISTERRRWERKNVSPCFSENIGRGSRGQGFGLVARWCVSLK
jgi:hypothetical protein